MAPPPEIEGPNPEGGGIHGRWRRPGEMSRLSENFIYCYLTSKLPVYSAENVSHTNYGLCQSPIVRSGGDGVLPGTTSGGQPVKTRRVYVHIRRASAKLSPTGLRWFRLI